MRSKRCSSHQFLVFLTSAISISAERFCLLRLSFNLCIRFLFISTAVTFKLGSYSSIWQVFPPGAAQASRTRRLGFRSRISGTYCDASSCILTKPSSKFGSKSTLQGVSRTTAVFVLPTEAVILCSLSRSR